MINISKPIQIEVRHFNIKKYTIDGLTLIESDGNHITFMSYPKMAKHLGLSKQGLYNKIRANMMPYETAHN